MSSFIPKDIYPAVMFARKIMRSGENVGLAVYKAAKYYGVDSSQVAQWLNGKKKTTPKDKKLKFCWNVIWVSSDYDGVWSLESKNIFQTDNRSNYSRKIARECANRSRRNDSGSVYSLFYTYDIAPKLYATKNEAITALDNFLIENLNKESYEQ